MKHLIIAKNLQAFRIFCGNNIPAKSIEMMRAEYIVLRNGDSFIYISQIEALKGHVAESVQVLFVDDWFLRSDGNEIVAFVKDRYPKNWKEV